MRELESKNEVSLVVIKAYILSLFLLLVVLFLAVGDAWSQCVEFYSLSTSFSSIYYSHHYVDFNLMTS